MDKSYYEYNRNLDDYKLEDLKLLSTRNLKSLYMFNQEMYESYEYALEHEKLNEIKKILLTRLKKPIGEFREPQLFVSWWFVFGIAVGCVATLIFHM